MGKKGRPVDRHHICPSSRVPFGKDANKDNVMYLDIKFHRKWHSLFNNMTLEEVIQLLKEMFTPDEVWNAKRIHRRMREIKGE